MLEKLESLERKYNELTEALSNPEVLADQPRFQKYAKARADLVDTVSREDAFRMLRALSGRAHVVHTALVVGMKTSGGFSLTATAADTTVNMALLSEDLISAYVESGDPFGKAGGYAIQNPDFRLVFVVCRLPTQIGRASCRERV